MDSYNKKGTVLVYTLVLVVLGVFMAVGVLNMVQRLSSDYDRRALDNILSDALRWKVSFITKFTNTLNSNGSGFVDMIWCPQNISFSGVTQSGSISTQLQYNEWIIFCNGEYDGNMVDVYFNSGFTDTQYLQFDNLYQIDFSSITHNAIISYDSGTLIDGDGAFPLLPDGFDDNFNSDDYSLKINTWSAVSPLYYDDDADARLKNFWYVFADTDWYNAFWVNSDIRNFVDINTNNADGINVKIGESNDAYMRIDIDKNFALQLYELDKDSYDNYSQIVPVEKFSSSGVNLPQIWYLQNDLSLSAAITGNEYVFDFENKDYALFIKNFGSGTLLYQIEAETQSGSGIYITPLRDDEPWFLSILTSHILIDKTGWLIGKISKILSLKEYTPPDTNVDGPYVPSIPTENLVWWYDFSSEYLTLNAGYVEEVVDRSGNARTLVQTNPSIRPLPSTYGITWNGAPDSYLEITSPTAIARVYARISYPSSTFIGYDYLLSWPYTSQSGSRGFGSPRIIGNRNNTTLINSKDPQDIQVSKNGGPYSLSPWLPLDGDVLTFSFSTPQIFTKVWGTIYVAASEDRQFRWEIEELLFYTSIPTAAQEAEILNYLQR